MENNELSKANSFFVEGKYKSAIELYKKAILNNEVYFYHENIAMAYRKLGEIKKSIAHAFKARNLNPKSELYSVYSELSSVSTKDVYQTIKSSRMLNASWYKNEYVSFALIDGFDPIEHYINYGAKRGFNPCKRFNTLKYIAANKGVDFDKINPLFHFIINCEDFEKGFVQNSDKNQELHIEIDLSNKLKNLKLYNKSNMAFFGERALEEVRRSFRNEKRNEFRVIKKIIETAESYLVNQPYSVVNKTTCAPSGDIRDYWHPAPYWWPNPNTADGLPYIYKDGERVPGTRMYEKASEKYDRTSIQRLFDECTVCSLAWYFSGDQKFIKKVYQHVKSWFIDPNTRMNPNLSYAQVVVGKNNNQGKPTGIIETKDFYYFIDALRLLKRSKYWSLKDDAELDKWFSEYYDWLKNSNQGKKEASATNNHGIAYDLQAFSIASFLGRKSEMKAILERAITRAYSHFDVNGYQAREMERTTTAHYTAFNLQLWLNFSLLVFNTLNVNILKFPRELDSGQGVNPIVSGIKWLLPFYRKVWPYEQLDEFDKERLVAIYQFGSALEDEISHEFKSIFPDKNNVKQVFFPHDGIAPYWMLNFTATNRFTMLNNHHFIPFDKSDIRNRIIKHLWGGLSALAIKDLEVILESNHYPKSSRILAGWELSRWYCFVGDDCSAYARILTILNVDPGLAFKKEIVLSKSFIEMRRGDLALARATLNNYQDKVAQDSDICLALANTVELEEDKLTLINKVYVLNGYIPVSRIDSQKPLGFSNISAIVPSDLYINDTHCKVSVIMPVYNASEQLHIAVNSLLSQTWRNLEIIIVDDCSTDDTYRIAKSLEKNDRRIKVLSMDKNGGAYKARNLGLKHSAGDFITTHDSDDWSHPQKIETELKFLLNNKSVMGVAVNWIRAKENLFFTQNWRPANTLIHKSESSFLFRKSVLDAIGIWNEVRIGGDNEYIGRVMNFFGKDSYRVIESKVPLSFGLDDENSLTRTKSTHVSTVYFGLRQIYREIWRYIHKSDDVDFKDIVLPRKMENNMAESIEIDTLLVADFSDSEETVSLFSSVEQNNARFGLLNVPAYKSKNTELCDEYFKFIFDKKAIPIVHGDDVRTLRIIFSREDINLDDLDKNPNIEIGEGVQNSVSAS